MVLPARPGRAKRATGGDRRRSLLTGTTASRLRSFEAVDSSPSTTIHSDGCKSFPGNRVQSCGFWQTGTTETITLRVRWRCTSSRPRRRAGRTPDRVVWRRGVETDVTQVDVVQFAITDVRVQNVRVGTRSDEWFTPSTNVRISSTEIRGRECLDSFILSSLFVYPSVVFVRPRPLCPRRGSEHLSGPRTNPGRKTKLGPSRDWETPQQSSSAHGRPLTVSGVFGCSSLGSELRFAPTRTDSKFWRTP